MGKGEPTIENILKFSTAAADEAQRLAECCSINRHALRRFEESIRRTQHELLRTFAGDIHGPSGKS